MNEKSERTRISLLLRLSTPPLDTLLERIRPLRRCRSSTSWLRTRIDHVLKVVKTGYMDLERRELERGSRGLLLGGGGGGEEGVDDEGEAGGEGDGKYREKGE